MRLTVTDVGMGLFPEITIVHQKVLIFRLRCLAHRLISFGFEEYVNSYSPRELAMLAALMFGPQHDFLATEAHRLGDDTVKAWLEQRLPYLFHVEQEASA